MITLSHLRAAAAALLMTLGLAACASDDSCRNPSVPLRSPAPDGAAQVQERYLDDALLFLGASYEYTCGERPSTQRLRSVLHVPSGRLTHQLAIRHNFDATGWRYYGSAMALAPDEVLTLHVAERQVGKCARMSWLGCEQAEELLVDLPDALVASAAEQARVIRIANKDGAEFRITLTPQQIRDHLALIASRR